ncbi:MAG: YqgE/AlgH family protein [Muribaculaceae bacterium]|nr:YqgE/AlgH family protein [Muribaculaceae bacterium]
MKDICSTLFDVPAATAIAPAGGKLLISEPFLEENCFTHSVVSLLDYDVTGGAIGVVLNHKSPSTLAEVLDDDSVKVRVPVYCGGPLALDRVFFLHNLGTDIIPGSRPYAPGLFVGGHFDAVLDYINSGYPLEGSVRFFVGYSSWETGQLERELADGAWAVADSPDDASRLLSGSGDAFWHSRVRDMGDAFRAWRLVPRMTCAN